ncbi:MAG: bifunctional aldolase/short-chain dehydrogenase [Thermodesulfobacteriota bacterium]
MENLYNDDEARDYAGRWPQVEAAVGLRVYTSRLLGREPSLVLHGGGNTSVKATVVNLLGDEVEILYIKGSGWDLATIEPAGFPGLDLSWLRRLRGLSTLSDEEMVNQFRTHLLNASSPDPSIETLVHAFLPHRFIDHTHADAIVALTNQSEGDLHVRRALGDRVGILPFIMPGFPLAQAIARLYEERPEIDCIVLMNHGIFTFADDARGAYERMLHYVGLAEDYIDGRMSAARPRPLAGGRTAPLPERLLPLLRGRLCPDAGDAPFLLRQRTSGAILAALARPDARQLFTTGVLTPDHVIRTKNRPVFLDLPPEPPDDRLAAAVAAAVADFQRDYDRYVAAQVAVKGERIRLDNLPRVFLVPGLGIVTAGRTVKEAEISADITEHTLAAKQWAAAVGAYRELGEAHIFDMEYWSLEQAKLGKKKPLPLTGRVALVTGGGGAIAAGIGRQLLAAGAQLVLSDIDAGRLDKVRRKLAGEFGEKAVAAEVMDVADAESVAACFRRLVAAYGGLDILVPNAGVAHVARIEELDADRFDRVLKVNLHGVFQVIKAAIPVFRAQGYGGQIVINSSKNVFDPGAAFGAYSASKAGAHQLGKIAALELAELGVRVNMINADAIFDDGEISSGLWDVVGPDRMRARNLDPQGLKEYYRQRNLLKTTVTADDVGRAVVFFATGQTPTTGATLPVDGGIAAAFPR